VIKVYFEYVIARVRGMKGRLLDPSVLETLIRKPDVESVIAVLENTAYKKEIEKASIQYSGIMCIEVALRKDFTSAFRKIFSLLEGENAEKYVKVLLNRWDIQNIKTILRGKNAHMLPAEILECLVPAGELDDITLIELTKQPDVKAVIDLLATWGIEYAEPLTRNFKEYTEKRDLAVLEIAIDKFRYENAIDAVKGYSYNDRIIREMIATEIDVTNIQTVLKMIRDKIDIKEAQTCLINGGSKLDIERLLAMIRTGTIKGAIKYLGTTPYNFLLKLPDEAFRAGKISVFERELEKYLIERGISRFFGDPLSIAVIVGYVWAKYNEITNIRIIARCKTADFSEKEIRGELIYV
ncbi:MAG: V-type ATPase subunit, partial [Methanomicrobiales archaeon]|nr:V-type ATPase subunit [Methanomicrobiales archaeon]